MSTPLLTLLAAKGRTGALIGATAVATAALVGGGGVVLQTVSSASKAPGAAVGEPGSKGRGAEQRSDTAKAATSGKKEAVAPVPFTCDPTKSHGENVSAYVHSLPKGPGRGRAVSEVAKSDCGKDVEDEAASASGSAPDPQKPADTGKPADPGKAPADPGKAPADPGKAPAGAGKSAEAPGPATAETSKDKPAKPSKNPTPS